MFGKGVATPSGIVNNVEKRFAFQVRLRADKTEYRPVFEDGQDDDALLDSVRFPAPLPERTALKLTVPPDLKDASGRPLANAASFPLTLATAPLPPLAKFAAAPFGIVERFAEGKDSTPLMPMTLRNVEPALAAQALQIGRVQPQTDADIIAWFTRVSGLTRPWCRASWPRATCASRCPSPSTTPPRTTWTRAACRCCKAWPTCSA